MKKLGEALTTSNYKSQQVTKISSTAPYRPANTPKFTPGVNMPTLGELDLAELRSELITMVRKICRLSRLTDISGELLNDTVNDWLELIGNDLTAKEILPAYQLAMRSRNSSFPLQPYEILNAHKQIVASRTVAVKGNCSYCGNTGTMKIFNPSTKKDDIVSCMGAMHKNDN